MNNCTKSKRARCAIYTQFKLLLLLLRAFLLMWLHYKKENIEKQSKSAKNKFIVSNKPPKSELP